MIPAIVAEPAISLFQAIVLGLVEGLTEFLPISSTGHLIVAGRLLGLPDDETAKVFEIAIQMGAISAILVLYWPRLVAALRTVMRPLQGQPNLLWQILVAAMPAAVLGLLADHWIEAHLFSPLVVAVTMVVGGVLLLVLERWQRQRPRIGVGQPRMSYATAFGIGLFQCLALIPGTSRSAATICGGMLLGQSRAAAAEFSFLVGLPILYGASLFKLRKHMDVLSGHALLPFVVATAVAFVSALLVVVPFVRFLRSHTFVPFAWYRVLAGIVLAVLCWRGVVA